MWNAVSSELVVPEPLQRRSATDVTSITMTIFHYIIIINGRNTWLQFPLTASARVWIAYRCCKQDPRFCQSPDLTWQSLLQLLPGRHLLHAEFKMTNKFQCKAGRSIDIDCDLLWLAVAGKMLVCTAWNWYLHSTEFAENSDNCILCLQNLPLEDGTPNHLYHPLPLPEVPMNLLDSCYWVYAMAHISEMWDWSTLLCGLLFQFTQSSVIICLRCLSFCDCSSDLAWNHNFERIQNHPTQLSLPTTCI